MLRSLAVTASLILATAAGAQDSPQPSAMRANNDAAAAIDSRQSTQTAANADAQAQYQADLAAYDAAVAGHDVRADRQAEHYRHQQRAYADAMAAWRAQDYACHHGSLRACNAPSPDPANYW